LYAASPTADFDSLREAAIGLDLCLVAVDNPSGARSAGLNRAVAAASESIIVRIDGRSVVPPDYVTRCAARLATSAVGVVGGHQVPSAWNGVVRRGIARGLRHPWLLGGSAYRRPAASGPVDTVYLGVFRRAELRRLGGWDERLGANEDFDLCRRYRAAGYLVYLEPGLDVEYEPRASVREVARQYFAFGRAKVVFWGVTGARPNGRQAIGLGGGLASALGGLLALRAGLRRAAIALCTTLAILDHLGDRGERSLRVRAVSIVTECSAVGAWTAGVAWEVFVRRSPASAPERPSPTPWSRRRP
jgi:hypothetical protein